MSKTLKDYFIEFDALGIQSISKEFYDDLGVKSGAVKCTAKFDKKNHLSEEYIRARFVYAIVHSGLYPKENIWVEYAMPKGNTKGTLNPDIVVFKKAEYNKEYSKETKFQMLLVCETKKNNKTVEKAIEEQLVMAMQYNESHDRIFGCYFDDSEEIIFLKKRGNESVKRFYEQKQEFGDLSLSKRDALLEMPSFKDLIENNESIIDKSKLKLKNLDAIDEQNFTGLLESLNRAKDKIKPKTDVNSLVVEFLTLKIFDEKESKKNEQYIRFYITEDERNNKNGNLKNFRNRIKVLYEQAKREYKNILSNPYFGYDDSGRPLNSQDEKFLIELVQDFQLNKIIDSRNESFNQIIFNNFGNASQKGEESQFFTPIPIVKSMIEILKPKNNESFCDPCCGIADFLAMGFRYNYLKNNNKDAGLFFGFDIEPKNLKLAELNLVLNGDGGATIKSFDSLTQKYLLDETISSEGEFNIEDYNVDWTNKSNRDKDVYKFDIIATNPPFGKGRDAKTGKNGKWDIKENVISLYETWHVKLASEDDKKTTKKPKSMDKGVLFLENTYRILKEGGRFSIILSNSIASIKEWENVRKWLLERVRIVALFDLPANTFGETGVATTVITGYKPKQNEMNLLHKNYEIFIKEIKNTGYEVKTKKRMIEFTPVFVLDEKTFEKTNQLDEDFTEMLQEFEEYMKRQEKEIKAAFHRE